MTHGKARCLLINYFGAPYALEALTPDNGLAALANCLRAEGHIPLIVDYCTLSEFRRLFSYEHQPKLNAVFARIAACLEQKNEPDPEDLKLFRALSDQIREYQVSKVGEVVAELTQVAESFQPDFIGFKLFGNNAFDSTVMVAEQLRQAVPNVPFFAGGPQIDWFGGTIFKRTKVFDALIRGEGETPILQLAEHALGKIGIDAVNNAIYLEDGKVRENETVEVADLNQTPFFCFDPNDYDRSYEDEQLLFYYYEESRGCPNACSFCIHPFKSGRLRREKDAARIVDEVEHAIRHQGRRAFRLAGSNPPSKLRKRIARELLRRKLDVAYSTFAHVNEIDEEDLQLFRDAGGTMLFFGIESGSRKILAESFNKKTTPEHIEMADKLCKQTGVPYIASIIYPAPLETDETAKETFDLLCRLRPDGVNIWIPLVINFTAWAREPERYQIEWVDPSTADTAMMNYLAQVPFPPALWKPMPYKINGETFETFARKSSDFMFDLKRAGMQTAVVDCTYTLAMLKGVDMVGFRQETSMLFGSGNYEGIKSYVKDLNQRTRNFSATPAAAGAASR